MEVWTDFVGGEGCMAQIWTDHTKTAPAFGQDVAKNMV